MRIAELSQRTGVSVPTIKYYLRERLLPAGELTSPNQAQYDESHVHRVRLVRALVEVGGLSIAATREVVELMHASGRTPLESIGKAHFAVLSAHADHSRTDPPGDAAVRRANELIERRGWQVRPTNPARDALAEVLAYFTRLGQDDVLGLVDEYADVAERLAVAEVGVLTERPDVDSMAETVVSLNVLGNALLAALRGLAQESVANDRFGHTG